MDAKMEAKLQELIDRQEIWQVLQNYGRGLDRIEPELARSCYFDGAIEDHGTFVGYPDEFVDWACNTSRAFENTRHGLMNHRCDLQGDKAYTETYYLFIGVRSPGPSLCSMGRYIDYFEKRNGEWRIADRICLIEKNFDLHDSTVSPDRPSVQPIAQDKTDASYQRPLRPRKPEAQ